ncbi:uncharacterized protein A1O5_00539 [Cladophialophora psammophila CBS 110553]|uniref:RTA1 like protein n=1 Tax=Cladophialophora psammophila CBS 110553 TaxID=1182543 RepID=W9XGF8_9EURO|nr:uncharacterized protein A1O5_00539 [Cladophialophora psammophila CBS 110553]EXJ76031.1 hypothetical protein A1O5_00539 [Cladophialophora psammophila CBS 110553]
MTAISCPNGETSQYEYLPSTAASVIFIIVFGTLTVGHIFLMIRGKQWFMAAFIVGGLFEVSGFGVRILGHNNPCNDNSEIAQKILILVAPSIFAATIYMILGRTVRAIRGDKLSPIRPSRLTVIFVSGDVACFCVQVAGAAIMSGGSSNKSNINLGRYIILVGLALQIILFGLFVFVAFIFHNRIHKRPTEASFRPQIRWEMMLFALYGVSSLIIVRNIFRVIETAGGRDGYLLSHESPLYVFDSILMAAVMAVLLYYFPTLIRPRKSYTTDSMEVQPIPAGHQNEGYRKVSAPPSSDSNIHHEIQR